MVYNYSNSDRHSKVNTYMLVSGVVCLGSITVVGKLLLLFVSQAKSVVHGERVFKFSQGPKRPVTCPCCACSG